MTNFSNWPGPDATRGAPPPPQFNQPPPQPHWGGPSIPPGDLKPRPAKNRKPLIITAAATVAVLTVIGVIVAFLMGSGDEGVSFNPNGSPTEVAKAYMEALSRGDAQAALDLSATQPATTDLLTDDILKKQLDKLPITEVEVIGEADRKPDADKRTAAVKVAAKFGGQRTEGKLDMVVVDNQWKLSAAFVDATTEEIHGYGDPEAAAALTVFGKPLPQSRHFYVFPGYLEMGTATPYVKVNELPPTTLDDVSALKDTGVEPKFSMGPDGLKAAQDAVLAWINKCFNPGDHTGCGDIITGTWTNTYDMSTMRVRGPVDLPPDIFRLPDHTTVVQVGGLNVPFTANEKTTGRVIDNSVSISDQVEVNIGVQPPKVALNR
ncbi:hypothetical protein ACP6C7_12145 [Mycolicibacterium septicum]|uniref:DUF4878 domain-containing protein n=1 Tax=Mycolicibacterium septicum TaxID=98668 RepID=A0ABW9LTV5_9MYCO